MKVFHETVGRNWVVLIDCTICSLYGGRVYYSLRLIFFSCDSAQHCQRTRVGCLWVCDEQRSCSEMDDRQTGTFGALEIYPPVSLADMVGENKRLHLKQRRSNTQACPLTSTHSHIHIQGCVHIARTYTKICFQ